jgi:translation initiation factor IF-3
LIDVDGTQLGIKSIEDAICISRERGHDLVEIASAATPPVCKILDFSKYRYEKEKQRRKAQKHQKGGHVKEIRFRPKIGEQDLNTKIRAMRRFLEARDRVRVSVIFYGREMDHRDLGYGLIEKVKEQLADVCVIESNPSMLGNRLILMLAPKK